LLSAPRKYLVEPPQRVEPGEEHYVRCRRVASGNEQGDGEWVAEILNTVIGETKLSPRKR
jgi:hypothetical protein